MIPATAPAMVAMMVILSVERPPLLPFGVEGVKGEVGDGREESGVLPGVAIINYPSFSSLSPQDQKAV